jgi:hypothetical protein
MLASRQDEASRTSLGRIDYSSDSGDQRVRLKRLLQPGCVAVFDRNLCAAITRDEQERNVAVAQGSRNGEHAFAAQVHIQHRAIDMRGGPDYAQAVSKRRNGAQDFHAQFGENLPREWTMSLGQRTAFERMAHLLCEIFFRLRLAGLTRQAACDFPLTQADLADATGLSKVHVNRTLQELRSANLIVLKGKTLVVPDLERLMQAGLFNANYLHIDREGRQLDANE